MIITEKPAFNQIFRVLYTWLKPHYTIKTYLSKQFQLFVLLKLLGLLLPLPALLLPDDVLHLLPALQPLQQTINLQSMLSLEEKCSGPV